MRKILIVVITAAMIISCGKNNEKGQVVDSKGYSALNEVKENNGKRFAVVGYPFIDSDITVQGPLAGSNQLPQISFYEEPGGKGKMIARFPIANGKGNNEFDAPETFTMEDVVFYDNDGKPLKYTDKMQVSFTMNLQTDRERMKHGDKLVYFGGPEDVRIDKAN